MGKSIKAFVFVLVFSTVPLVWHGAPPAQAASPTFLREFWPIYGEGGIRNFGYVITDPIRMADGRIIQYTERARFELGADGQARIGELGRERVGSALGNPAFNPIPPFPDSPEGCRYFAETGHSLCFGFRYFWEHNGGEAVFGVPISEEFDEANPDTGVNYTVQYFTRARFEYHPEAPPEWRVQLGRLGAQDAAEKGIATVEPFLPPVEPFTDDQRRARDLLNQVRSVAGVPAVRLDPSLNTSATSYSNYVLWDLQRGRRLPNHLEEDTSNPFYTGYHPWDRALAAGYYSDRSIGETFIWGSATGGNLPEVTIRQLMGAPYHRATLLSPILTDFGYGNAVGPTLWGIYQVATLDWGGKPTFSGLQVVKWPVDGAIGVPPAWFDDEFPNPLPDHYLYTYVGYPVSLGLIYPDVTARGTWVDDAGIYRRGTDPIAVRIAPSPYGEPDQWVHVIPLRPLEPMTTYVVRISGRDGRGVSFRHEWSFTTGR